MSAAFVHVPPVEPSADAAQEAIISEFALLGDWTERYQYLIDLGRRLAPYPPELQDDAHRVQGCQSQVWVATSGDARCLDFRAASDSTIVAGLLALLLRVYSGRSAADILATEPRFVEAIGLAKHLSPTRTNGFLSVLNTIKAAASTVGNLE